MVKKIWRCVYSFRQNTRTWKTDTARRHRPRLCLASRGENCTTCQILPGCKHEVRWRWLTSRRGLRCDRRKSTRRRFRECRVESERVNVIVTGEWTRRAVIVVVANQRAHILYKQQHVVVQACINRRRRSYYYIILITLHYILHYKEQHENSFRWRNLASIMYAHRRIGVVFARHSEIRCLWCDLKLDKQLNREHNRVRLKI